MLADCPLKSSPPCRRMPDKWLADAWSDAIRACYLNGNSNENNRVREEIEMERSIP